jgi:Ca2+:H+ antiporter
MPGLTLPGYLLPNLWPAVLLTLAGMSRGSEMAVVTTERMPWWAWVWPMLGWILLVVTTVVSMSGILAAAAGAAMIATVFAAVYHAEVVAHRVGEPFGTLVLALAVTIIEVALIVSIMMAGKGDTAGLARDTVFAAVMIVCNGIVGLCLLSGGVRHHEQGFQVAGANAALAVLAALTTLTLVLPNFTTSAAGPVFSTSQLVFSGVISGLPDVGDPGVMLIQRWSGRQR